MATIKTLEQLANQLEKEQNVAHGPDNINNDEYLQLSSVLNFIEYTTPWASSYSIVNKYRKLWGKSVWLKFLEGLEQGRFWHRLNDEQHYFLVHGKEMGER